MTIIPSDVTRAYQKLANDPKFQHFVRIPDRIIQCIDYFGIECDRATARKRLHAYYLFIGVVDDAIDSGRIDAGQLVLHHLSKPASQFDSVSSCSSVRLITAVLKSHMSSEVYPLMMDKLRQLYHEVVSEREATSIDSYISHRRSVGSLTAELSCVLIRPALNGEHESLLHFMKQVGAIGCLIDSLIDLSADRRHGLLGFKPSVMDYSKLIICILRDGLRVSLKHLGLSALFVQAIGDNLRDRLGRPQSPVALYAAAERKDEAASVA
jgi:hypothetical protein